MIGIDWVAVVVLGAAWAFSMVRSVPQYIRHWVFALGCFVVAGVRLYRGAQGTNFIFVAVVLFFGVQSAVRALRTPKNR